eukprot:2325346-Rhodomonas_salina.1
MECRDAGSGLTSGVRPGVAQVQTVRPRSVSSIGHWSSVRELGSSARRGGGGGANNLNQRTLTGRER